MKKTDKTALTAAVFAAALNVVPMGASAYDPSEEEIQDVYGPPAYYETTTFEEPVPQPDYGPMPAWTTETTAVPEETTTEVTEVIPQPAYGPPIATGDTNFDGVVDSFDLINMRKLFSKANYSVYYDRAADINEDGILTVADLVLMNRYLLGRDKVIGVPDIYDEPDVTTTTENNYASVYGPPAWFEEQTTAVATVEEPVTTLQTEFFAVYGPPAWFEQQTATTTAPYEDPIGDTETTFTTVYGPPAMMRNTETTAVPEVDETAED